MTEDQLPTTNEVVGKQNKNKLNLAEALPKVIFICLIFALGVWVGQNVALPFGKQRAPIINIANKNAPQEILVDFKPFWDVWERITTNYLEKSKLDTQKLLYGAISGMVKAVGDPYTVFLNPEENREFELALSGTYEGVGIELDIRDEKLVVLAPIEGSPAQKAGVLAGDTILEIDGTDTSTLTIQDAVKKIRGKAGTSVKLKLGRDGKVFDVEIGRAQITIKSVEFKDLSAGVAGVKIIRFGDNTEREWGEAVSKVIAGGYKRLVLDLRNNPGGILETAVVIVGDFVPKGSKVVLEEDSSGKRLPLASKEDPRLSGVKLVVLINKGSASASEIVAGALRDILGVKLIGETSFGKGTIQKPETLPDSSGLHITIAKWLTPNGTWVHKVGLKPDVEVKLTEEDIKNNRDPQLERAKELLK
ncbi:MAG: hypothetical protein A2126_02160 [Candidatus Woykebacteria bacterium GWB1_45_5]|uniref:PDZ domain-containing protein n=2 Tax=Candidatus Woykeibacteriota TaxID=1817899 RepID=A0A1G1W3B4_9BACT|nr:MAG: hypothetical protein A2113_02580 [Candidatus Woykebacteria bacterium GWA1_44_8]OGY23934.1 MAG: hypothetical protein A2126_02160 [Candidatus Woykebacteria bacterium GWB1_45_5]